MWSLIRIIETGHAHEFISASVDGKGDERGGAAGVSRDSDII
jgi:hypothetical protein